MNRNENELWNSRLTKVLKMVDMYSDRKMLEASAINNKDYDSKYFKRKSEVKTIKSLKEIEGW